MNKLDLQRQIALTEDAIMNLYSHMNESATKGDANKTSELMHCINSLQRKLCELTGEDYGEIGEDLSSLNCSVSAKSSKSSKKSSPKKRKSK